MKSTDLKGASRSTTRSLLSVGAMTLGVTSQAEIFYSNFSDLTIGPDPDGDLFNRSVTSGYVYFDFATPSITRALGFGLPKSVRFGAVDHVQKKGKSIGAFRQMFSDGDISSSLLAPGALIDASTSWQFGADLTGGLADVFTGVRIQTSPGSSQYWYGWIRFSTGPNDPALGSPEAASSIIIKDAAFETTAGVGIVAGAVPEASGWGAISFLGLAGGVEAFRRLRSQRTSFSNRIQPATSE